MKQFYKNVNFRATSLAQIEVINGIIDEYRAQGFRLTVRQLYYQLVARAIIPNTERSYKNTVSLVNDGRVAGLIDWSAIEDRTRAFSRRFHAESGEEVIRNAAGGYHMDMWTNQEHRVFIIVEKEALVGVLDRVSYTFDVPLLGARGYPSATVLRDFSLYDVQTCREGGQTPVILHLGDHDPSGMDMSRDLDERVALFAECDVGEIEFHRIALNMDQIRKENPPPNPAKTTDARYAEYRRNFGVDSWELDALNPSYLSKLVERKIKPYIDQERWQERKDEIEVIREKLQRVAEYFDKPPDEGGTPPAPRSNTPGGGIDSLL